jgi:hypothetical protein
VLLALALCSGRLGVFGLLLGTTGFALFSLK